MCWAAEIPETAVHSVESTVQALSHMHTYTPLPPTKIHPTTVPPLLQGVWCCLRPTEDSKLQGSSTSTTGLCSRQQL